jgi:hypothetical protein
MDYRLKPIGKTCAATDVPLEPGSRVHSVLIDQDGALVRLDYCQQAWEGPPQDTIAHWQCTVPRPESDKPRPLDADTLLEHFERMIEDANPARQQLCYVIALLLMQKRRLQLERTRYDGETAWLEFVGQRGEGPFEVRDQQLTGEEIAELQQTLSRHLGAAA